MAPCSDASITSYDMADASLFFSMPCLPGTRVSLCERPLLPRRSSCKPQALSWVSISVMGASVPSCPTQRWWLVFAPSPVLAALGGLSCSAAQGAARGHPWLWVGSREALVCSQGFVSPEERHGSKQRSSYSPGIKIKVFTEERFSFLFKCTQLSTEVFGHFQITSRPCCSYSPSGFRKVPL